MKKTLVLALIALPGIIDGRTPVFVADRYGVRLHQGDNWVGLLWREISEIVVNPGTGGRDACIRIVAKDAHRTYVCPVGLATTVSVAEAEVELARRRAAAARLDAASVWRIRARRAMIDERPNERTN